MGDYRYRFRERPPYFVRIDAVFVDEHEGFQRQAMHKLPDGALWDRNAFSGVNEANALAQAAFEDCNVA